MESSKSLEYKVGIFVAIATIMAIGFILALGGDKAIFHRNYTLHIKADETGGLSLGSVVQMSGLPAGNVIAVDFDPESTGVVVTMRLDRRFLSRTTKGTVATVQTQGALGDKYINLKPGPANAPPLADGDFIEIEAAGDLFSTLGKSGSKIEKMFSILEEVDKLTHDLNQKNFAGNMADASRNLKTASLTMAELLQQIKGSDPANSKLKKSLDHFESIMAKIDSGQGTIGGLINDPTVHEDIKTILGGAKRSKILKYIIRQATKGGEEEEKAPTK